MTTKTKAAAAVLAAVLAGALTGCGITFNSGTSDTDKTTPAASRSATTDSTPDEPGPTATTGQDGSSAADGQGTTTATGQDGTSYVAGTESLSYNGPDGTFLINPDHSISASFPDGTTCSADINEKLVSRSGSSGMRCTIHVYSDGEVNLNVLAADGTKLWKLESAYAGTAPDVHRYVDGSEVDFP